MSDRSDVGVLYTHHLALAAGTPIASLWSYESGVRGPHRPPVTVNRDGSHEYWLERSDPLLNTMLPSTQISLVINFADLWAAGRSLTMSALLPRACVVGPATYSRIMRVGASVRAVGAVMAPILAQAAFGLPASELVDAIVPLEDLWTRHSSEQLLDRLSGHDVRVCLSSLRDDILARFRASSADDPIARSAPRLISLHGGRVSVDDMARSHGLSRQLFTRRFAYAAGMPPKLFARITRFQALVRVLLSTDVARWSSAALTAGFYDQSHMINEFRALTGLSPTIFFQPHSDDRRKVRLRGRPSDWLIGDSVS